MAQCLKPFELKNSDRKGQKVACGSCPTCLKRKASSWSIRLQEHLKHKNRFAMFITLTYDEKHLRYADHRPTLVKRDLQLFFKRMRKKQDAKISYYAVGEYGSQTKRPHYHIILFNANYTNIQNAWCEQRRHSRQAPEHLGKVHFGECNIKTIGYTLKYVSKKKSDIGRRSNDPREREFSLMSKGLGLDYLNIANIKWHKQDLENRMYIPLPDNKKAAMPRYYKDKIYQENEKLRIQHAQEIREIDNILKQLMENATPEKAHRARWKKKQAIEAQYRVHQIVKHQKL